MKKLLQKKVQHPLQKISHRNSLFVNGISDPMTYTTGILLGQITKISGFEGAVTVKLERNFSGELPHKGPVFLEIEGRPVPFFIEDSEYPGAESLRLKFQGYDSPDQVKVFTGCRVYLVSAGGGGEPGEDMNFLSGFRVVTAEGEELGTISEIIENPAQPLLSLSSPGKRELLIPLHEDLIIKLDRKKKLVVMDLPEGLTEIN